MICVVVSFSVYLDMKVLTAKLYFHSSADSSVRLDNIPAL